MPHLIGIVTLLLLALVIEKEFTLRFINNLSLAGTEDNSKETN